MAVFTILAEGSRYALLGDATGQIIAMPKAELHKLSSGYNHAELVPCPPKGTPTAGRLKMIVRLDLPPEVILTFKYYTDELSRITIYYIFYQGRYLVRELRNEQGNGSGNYYREAD
jgi:hypothetical protein